MPVLLGALSGLSWKRFDGLVGWADFTTGQFAVLRLVGDEMDCSGGYRLCIDAIAARAGICRRRSRGAIRLTEGYGLPTIDDRRHHHREEPRAYEIGFRPIGVEFRTPIHRRHKNPVAGLSCDLNQLTIILMLSRFGSDLLSKAMEP